MEFENFDRVRFLKKMIILSIAWQKEKKIYILYGFDSFDPIKCRFVYFFKGGLTQSINTFDNLVQEVTLLQIPSMCSRD